MKDKDNEKEYDEVEDLSQNRPHVVILGAGASYAAFPNGDRNGLKLPLMNNLVEVLSLGDLFEEYSVIHKNVNFETLYSQLSEKPEYKELLKKIEQRVYEYFSSLQLPENPTLYDYLVLSLHSKDVIATFNWDPFLVDACNRNYDRIKELPKTLFLHGNVRIGVDIETKRKGIVGTICKTSGRIFQPSRLLFPIEKKEYVHDEFINSEWNALKNYFKNAYIVTIFGYGAPKSDVEAIALMKEAWGDVENRQFEQIEIIDIRDKEELRNLWDNFIHTHHYEVHDSFHDSIVSNHPRRTCEAIWTMLMEARFINQRPIPEDLNFNDLYDWLRPRILKEREAIN